MSHTAKFDAAFARCPLIAILRGIRPDEVEMIGEALVEAGFTIIEVPLNSPEPLESIARLAHKLKDRAVVGAGTVLNVNQIEEILAAKGTMIISPNTDSKVIQASIEAGLVSVPGFITPSEAFLALSAGAHALKLFPAELTTPPILSAFRAVLPKECRILPVGGINPGNIQSWRNAGAAGFGLGSALYQPGLAATDVSQRAKAFIRSLAV